MTDVLPDPLAVVLGAGLEQATDIVDKVTPE
jgi:hypothetical protein